jgi:16S rRNA (guanine966-N2)-methyltransferase
MRACGGDDGPVRVIAGVAKGRRLRAPGTDATRPITDRAKESLFSILGPRIAEASFLDLFAGTGSVGIEALSRGGARATFVEKAPRAAANVRHNLEITGLRTRGEVVTRDVFAYLREEPSPFDVIFVGPPQWRGLWQRAVTVLDQRPGWLAGGGLVVAQHDPAEDAVPSLRVLRPAGERTYGRVRFSFFTGPDAAG